MAAVLASLGLPLVKWVLAKLGPYLKAQYKIMVAKFILWLKIKSAKKHDQSEMEAIKKKVEDAKTDAEINEAIDLLRHHF